MSDEDRQTCTAQTYGGRRRCRNRPEPGTDRCAFHPSGATE